MIISKGCVVDAHSAPAPRYSGAGLVATCRGASDIQGMPRCEFRCRTCGSTFTESRPRPRSGRAARRPDRGPSHPGRPAARRHHRPAGQPPPQFPAHYTPVFAHRFLVAFLDLSADRQPRHSGRNAAGPRAPRVPNGMSDGRLLSRPLSRSRRRLRRRPPAGGAGAPSSPVGQLVRRHRSTIVRPTRAASRALRVAPRWPPDTPNPTAPSGASGSAIGSAARSAPALCVPPWCPRPPSNDSRSPSPSRSRTRSSRRRGQRRTGRNALVANRSRVRFP